MTGTAPAPLPPAPPRGGPAAMLVLAAVVLVLFGLPMAVLCGLGVIFAAAAFSEDPHGALTTILVLVPLGLLPLIAAGFVVRGFIRAARR